MTLEDVRLLYAYNSWANHRVVDACAPVDTAKSTQNLHSSFSSIRDTLRHVMFAEWLWLERWLGRSPGFPAEEFPDLASLRSRWQKIEADLNAFVGKLSVADLERVVEYKNTKGHAFANPMWQMLQHVVNHGTYHRGQVTTMLRQLAGTPIATDLIAFYREQAGQPLS